MKDRAEYFEAKKELDKIKRENDLLFRLRLRHLIDVGRRHLTEEEVENTCSEIMAGNGSKMITPEFMCSIVRTAYRISKIDTSFLLKYIADNIDDIVQILGIDNDDEDDESISD